MLFVSGLLPLTSHAEKLDIKSITLLNVNAAITPATYDYLKQGLRGLPANSLAVIRLNTPGGLVTTTKDIITLIGKGEVPVVVWITPEGASASSAGAIIASAAHFIFMSPGTNMGAATPIGISGDIKEDDGRQKAINDLTAMVRSLSELRGRPALPYEEMISKAKSFTDKESMKLKMIDGVASNLDELLTQIQGKKIRVQGKDLELNVLATASPNEVAPTLGQQLLDVIANPSTAYFLFLLGVALIYFELQAPGGFIAGTAGFVFLILAAVAFQVLPLNWGAFGLLILGIGFFVLEIFVTSYGLLTLAGLSVFVLGSLFLFKGDEGFISIEYPVIFSTMAGVFTGTGLIVWYLIHDKKKQQIPKDFFLPVGDSGVVISGNGREVMIRVRGELWKANSNEELSPGDRVTVQRADPKYLILDVKKISS